MKQIALALVLAASLTGCSMVTELMGLDFESQLADFVEQLETFRDTAAEVEKTEQD